VKYRLKSLVAVLSLSAVAWLGEPPATTKNLQGVQHLSLRLLDSATVGESCEGEGLQVWRIEVRSPSKSDTLVNIIEPWPVLVGDTALFGVAATPDGCTRRLFHYTPQTGRNTSFPLPVGMWHYFSDVSVSLDGRYVLYLRMDTLGRETAVVTRWPTGPTLVRGPFRDGCECDVDRHHAHWVTPDSFELATHLGRGDLYERVSGSVRARRVHLDTLKTTDQYWHPPVR
jgi:hypothetical protein